MTMKEKIMKEYKMAYMAYCYGVKKQRNENLEIVEFVAIQNLIDKYRMVMEVLENCMNKKDIEMLDEIKAEIENHVYYGVSA